MTITEFILARVAEDEATARQVAAAPWPHYYSSPPPPWLLWSGWTADEDGDPCVGATAARVLAECEAKRRIVSRHIKDTVQEGWNEESEYCITCCWKEGRRREAYPCATVRLLARPYADHPDYQPEWKVL